MAIDVPDRGKPETTMIGAPCPRRRISCSKLRTLMRFRIVDCGWHIASGGNQQRYLPSHTFVLAVVLLFALAAPAQAYIGPGAGFAVLSSFVAVFTTVIVA